MMIGSTSLVRQVSNRGKVQQIDIGDARRTLEKEIAAYFQTSKPSSFIVYTRCMAHYKVPAAIVHL